MPISEGQQWQKSMKHDEIAKTPDCALQNITLINPILICDNGFKNSAQMCMLAA